MTSRCWAVALALVASLAGAQDPGSYVLDWREPVLVQWEAGCTRPEPRQVRNELKAGIARVRKDVGDGKVPRLGHRLTPSLPYTLSFELDPGCPGGEIACSTRELEYREARFDCDRRGILAVDHELEHRAAKVLAVVIRLLGGDPAYVAQWAGHHERNDPKRPVLGVLGRPRP